MNFKKFKKKVKKFLIREKDILYSIGKYNIWLPSSHTLPINQLRYKNYDKKLKGIISGIEKCKGKGAIIDIGANVGDTAAYLRSFTESIIYCVEGDYYFLKYLKRNAEFIPDIKIIDSFVSGNSSDLKYGIQRAGGTASLVESGAPIEDLKMISLSEIVSDVMKENDNLNLIKIDTDGFDFEILLSNKETINRFKPSLYFEYDIGFRETGFEDSLEVISYLEKLGYKFIIYDNYGNLLDYCFEDCYEKFVRLNHYLQSSRTHGGEIYYFDIFTSTHKDIISLIIDEG